MDLQRRSSPDFFSSGFLYSTLWDALPLIGLALLLALVFAPRVSHAEDGIVEINAVCAETTGCFSGDAPGYPVTIDGSAGGSYRLSSSLVLPTPDDTGIELAANDITIDLGGFRIASLACATSPGTCPMGSGFGSGITSVPLGGTGVTVFNGAIVGTGHGGISLASASIVHHVKVRLTGGAGVLLGENAHVRRVQSLQNNGHGIAVSRGSIVLESVSADNSAAGISAGEVSKVMHNVVYSNGWHGIRVLGAGGIVEENLLKSNRTDTEAPLDYAAVSLQSGIASGNVIVTDQPGNRSLGLTGGSLAENNVVWSSSGTGPVEFDATQTGYQGNVFGPSVPISGGINQGGNLCNGVICP